MAHKSHDPCFHKKYMEAGVMTFAAHCTVADPYLPLREQLWIGRTEDQIISARNHWAEQFISGEINNPDPGQGIIAMREWLMSPVTI